MIDRIALVEGIGASLYKGSRLTPGTTLGILTIIDAWERLAPAADLRWIAYSLATAYHETAATFAPLREYGRGKGRKYGVPDTKTGHIYYGRGYVQLTWKANYEKMGRKLGRDFVNVPDKVMEPKIAAEILVRGMVDGDFTTRALSRYILGSKCDYIGARYIINGKDKAELIAGYAKKIEKCLRHRTEAPLVAKAEPVESPAPVSSAPSAPSAAVTNNPPVMSATSPTPPVGLWARVKSWFA